MVGSPINPREIGYRSADIRYGQLCVVMLYMMRFGRFNVHCAWFGVAAERDRSVDWVLCCVNGLLRWLLACFCVW